MALEGKRDRQQSSVHEEVDAAGDDTGQVERQLAAAEPAAEVEDAARSEPRQGQAADVEEHLVYRRAPRAPLHHARRHGQEQRHTHVEQSHAGDRADCADRDRAVVDLDRDRLPDRNENCDRDDPSPVDVTVLEYRGGDTRADADDADKGDQRRHSEREREEVGVLGSVRAWMALADGRRSLLVLGDLSGNLEVTGQRWRQHGCFGARGLNTISALQLGPVDGQVGLVNEGVLVGAVAGERGDPDRDGGVDRLARGRDVEGPLGDGAANPLGDLDRFLDRGLGQEDAELLAPEASGHVVVAELGAEDLGDSAENRVSGEMPVGVVDLAQEIEVDHQHRERVAVAHSPRQLVGEHTPEVTCVVETGLGIDPRLLLQPRHRQRALHESQRRQARTAPATSRMPRSRRSPRP